MQKYDPEIEELEAQAKCQHEIKTTYSDDQQFRYEDCEKCGLSISVDLDALQHQRENEY